MKEILLLSWLCFYSCFNIAAQPIGSMFDFKHPASCNFSNSFNSPASGFVMPAVFAVSKLDFLLIGKKPFTIKGISAMEAFVTLPVTKGTGLGIAVSRFGNGNMSEVSLASGIGKKLTNHILFGISGQFVLRQINGFNSQKSINLASSIHWSSSQYQIGGYFHYTAKSFYLEEKGNYLLGLGIGKDWSEEFYSDFAFSFATYYGTSFRLSMLYQFVESWQLAISIETNPIRYGFETGYVYRSMCLRIGNSWFPELGWSPSLHVGYTPFRKRL